MNKSKGQIRVGVRKYTRDSPSGFIDPVYPGFIPIIVLTKSSQWGSLGPYVIKDEKERIFENVWQFSKIYKTVPKSRQVYSRFNNSVIWEHPAETHMDEKGEPTEAYWAWREKGMKCEYAVRYPVGKHYRSKCVCALHEVKDDDEGDYGSDDVLTFISLDYIEARKRIYLPEYIRLVKPLRDFRRLLNMLSEGKNLLIIEVDGPHQESLQYYKDTYHVGDDFIENSTMLCTEENLHIMLEDPKHPFGHGYALAWGLIGFDLP